MGGYSKLPNFYRLNKSLINMVLHDHVSALWTLILFPTLVAMITPCRFLSTRYSQCSMGDNNYGMLRKPRWNTSIPSLAACWGD